MVVSRFKRTYRTDFLNEILFNFFIPFQKRKKNKNPLKEDSLYNDILLTLKYGKIYFSQKSYIKITRYS